jgi:hypothetical protein
LTGVRMGYKLQSHRLRDIDYKKRQAQYGKDIFR